MNRILFVDDEPAFLESLQLLLRRQRSVWDMTFALGPEEAMEQLARGTFDVVVSDMRMPGMDGAELLHRVRELDPGAARLVLSGYADPEMLARAIPVAQQYLAKPCPVASLRRVLERVCDLQRTLNNPAVRALVGRLDRLPAMPESSTRLREAVDRPSVALGDVAPIVARDPALSAKVLQLANAPYFGKGAAVTSLPEATALLGPELILQLPMMMHALGEEKPVPAGSVACPLQQSSIATARLAARFASTPDEAELAFTAGLLHEIGRILLQRADGGTMVQVTRQAIVSNQPMTRIEREVLGASHAVIGAFLLGMWGLPLPVVEAVAYHHVIPVARGPESRLTAILHAADVLIEQALATQFGGPPAEELDLAGLDELGFTPLLPGWRELAQAEARAIRGMP